MAVVSCNLFFDQATEDAVRDRWRRLINVGLPAKSVAGYSPHITVTAYVTDDPLATTAELADRLAPITASQVPIALRLETLGIFPETGVVFLAPRISRALLAVHRTVFERLAGPGMPKLLEDLLLPDRWTPHVTLAGRLDAEQIARIVDAGVRDWQSIVGEAVGLGLRIPPAVVDVQRLAFGS